MRPAFPFCRCSRTLTATARVIFSRRSVKREFHAGRTDEHFTPILKATVLLLFVWEISGHRCSFDHTIDRSIVRPQLMSRSDFSLRAVFVSIALSSSVVFDQPYLCALSPLIPGFRFSLFSLFPLFSSHVCLLPANSLPFFIEILFEKKSRYSQFVNIKVFISLLKKPLSIQSFRNRACPCSYSTKQRKLYNASFNLFTIYAILVCTKLTDWEKISVYKFLENVEFQ